MSNRYREHRIRSSWPRLPSSTSPEERREFARELWRMFGVLIVWPDQNIGGWPEQAMRDNIGRRLYGERVK